MERAPPDQVPRALLFVYTSPGPRIPLSEFTEWYDGYHAPSRAAVPGILTTTRFEAIDNQKPEWLTTYELSEASVLTSAPYRKLWEARPLHEKDLLDRIEVLDRRVYTRISRKARSGPWDPSRQRIFAVVGLQPKQGSGMSEDEFDRWYEEELIPILSKVPGWLRSTRWKLEDVKGVNMSEVEHPERVSGLLAVHEWETMESYETSEQKIAMSTVWRSRVMERVDKVSEERRTFKVYKDFSTSN